MKQTKNENAYTSNDAGCFVDGSKGIYMFDDIVDIARDHGANIPHNCDDHNYDDHAGTCFESEFAGCEFANEYVDEAEVYMNDHFPVENHYWGFSYGGGDWGLWPNEEA